MKTGRNMVVAMVHSLLDQVVHYEIRNEHNGDTRPPKPVEPSIGKEIHKNQVETHDSGIPEGMEGGSRLLEFAALDVLVGHKMLLDADSQPGHRPQEPRIPKSGHDINKEQIGAEGHENRQMDVKSALGIALKA